MSVFIWKYEVGIGETELSMPDFSVIIHAAEQQGIMYVWAAVNPKYDNVIRKIFVTGTGHEVDDDVFVRIVKHLETVHIQGTSLGELVWHVFEIN